MPIAKLVPNIAPVDASAEISSGAYTDIDETFASADSTYMDTATNNWAGGAVVDFGLSDLPGSADSINSVTLRVGADVYGDITPDDTIGYTFQVIGTNAGTATVIWDDSDAAIQAIEARTATVTGTGTVANINSWIIRLTQSSWSQNMAKDGMFLRMESLELEVDYNLAAAPILTLPVETNLEATTATIGCTTDTA